MIYFSARFESMGKSSTNNVTALVLATSEELRALIGRRSLSQRQLASLSGVSQSVISKSIYRNESVLNLSQFESICEALGASPALVLEHAERAVLSAQRNPFNEQRPDTTGTDQSYWVKAAKNDPRNTRHPDFEEGVEYYE